jgi:hypothetical protein
MQKIKKSHKKIDIYLIGTIRVIVTIAKKVRMQSTHIKEEMMWMVLVKKAFTKYRL